MNNKENIYPGDLPQCENCMLTLRQCEMCTSANMCKIWNEFKKIELKEMTMSKINDKINILNSSSTEDNDILNKAYRIKQNVSAINDMVMNTKCDIINTQTKQGKEYVKNPPHYHSKCSDSEMKAIIERINKRGYIEAIDVIDAFFKHNFNLASAFRYEARVGYKDDEITELEKAKWYIEHEIEARKNK